MTELEKAQISVRSHLGKVVDLGDGRGLYVFVGVDRLSRTVDKWDFKSPDGKIPEVTWLREDGVLVKMRHSWFILLQMLEAV